MGTAYRPVARPDYLTRQQAADLLGRSTKTIDRWIKSGRLTPVQGSGPRRRGVTMASVEAVLRENAEDAR